MRALDVGTVCIKTTGREAGEKVVVAQVVDDNFVIVEDNGEKTVRKRKCNIAHLIPISTEHKHAKQLKHSKKGK